MRRSRAEHLGKRGVTDVLAVSLSANDYVGHSYGPHSQEVFDLTVPTDSLLAGFWKVLDERVGLDHCTIVLTSDHGVAPIPEYISSHVPGSGAHRVDPADLRAPRPPGPLTPPPGNGGTAWIERVEGAICSLDRHSVSASGLDLDAASRILATELTSFDEVVAIFTSGDLLGPPTTPSNAGFGTVSWRVGAAIWSLSSSRFSCRDNPRGPRTALPIRTTRTFRSCSPGLTSAPGSRHPGEPRRYRTDTLGAAGYRTPLAVHRTGARRGDPPEQ